MKRHYIKEKTPLKYHKFCRWVALPLSILFNLATVITTLGTAELNWGHAIDLGFNILLTLLALIAFVGFFRWSPASWYAIVGAEVCGIVYRAVVLAVIARFTPDEIDSALGELLGYTVVAVLIIIYYVKRRPLFFPQEVPVQMECGSDTASVLFCRKCGERLSEGSRFCSRCGADSREGSAPGPEVTGKKRASRRWPLAVILAVLILAAVLCAGLMGSEDTAREPSADEPAVTDAADALPQSTLLPVTPEPEQEVSLDRVAESVLYLDIYGEDMNLIGNASGFLVNDGSTLVTNYHVVEDAERIMAWTADEREWAVADVLLAYDEVAALAVLRCEDAFTCAPLVLADSDGVKQGQTVYAVGYPLGIANTMSDGIVSARYEDEYGVDIIQTTAAISQGNSGGPLVNSDGYVVGVVCAYYVDGQNLNLAVASDTLSALLEQDSREIRLDQWTDRPGGAGADDPADDDPGGTADGQTDRQAAAWQMLYAWVEENYTDAWNDGSVSYVEEFTDEEVGIDYNIEVWLYSADEIVLQCTVWAEDYIDAVYVSLYADAQFCPVEHAYYDSLDAEETAFYGWAELYAPDLGREGAIAYYDYETEAEGYMTDADFAVYLDACAGMAETLCEMAVWFGDYVLYDLVSGGLYSMADFGFTV